MMVLTAESGAVLIRFAGTPNSMSLFLRISPDNDLFHLTVHVSCQFLEEGRENKDGLVDGRCFTPSF